MQIIYETISPHMHPPSRYKYSSGAGWPDSTHPLYELYPFCIHCETLDTSTEHRNTGGIPNGPTVGERPNPRVKRPSTSRSIVARRRFSNVPIVFAQTAHRGRNLPKFESASAITSRGVLSPQKYGGNTLHWVDGLGYSHIGCRVHGGATIFLPSKHRKRYASPPLSFNSRGFSIFATANRAAARHACVR